LGLDGIPYFYDGHEAIIDHTLTEAFINHSHWPEKLQKPYITPGDPVLVNKVGQGLEQGITITSPGFYGPQGRMIRIPLAHPEINEKLTTFEAGDLKITNYEMETAALFALSSMMGHKAASVCMVLANRVTGEYAKEHEKPMKLLVERIVEKLVE
jgi:uridine phosphorylase